MTPYEPILLVPSQPTDNRRKGGGGSAKKPLVPVTDGLRSSLAAQLSEVLQKVASLPSAAPTVNLPLVVRVRDRALAKSNRPYDFLAAADLPTAATGGPGELVARASVSNVENLRYRIERASRKPDLFAISSFESFRLWDPLLDAFHSVEDIYPQAVLDEASSTGKPLRIDFFPWLSLDTPWVDGNPLGETLGRLGLHALLESKSQRRPTVYFHVDEKARAQDLGLIYGIRSVGLTPTYGAFETIERQWIAMVDPQPSVDLGVPGDVAARVGVLDSGVDCPALSPWLIDNVRYDLDSDCDAAHGTFVTGLIVGSRRLNLNDHRFPSDSALVLNAQVLPRGAISEYLLLERIEETIKKFSKQGIKVWNCSFASTVELDPLGYSTFAEELDRVSEDHGVLFVQAMGNYGDSPRRTWPLTAGHVLRDGISSPADAVNSLAVGSLAHLGGCVPIGAPSSYSRRGPGFGGQMKPDVTHWSGDLDRNGSLAGHGVRSLQPGGGVAESVGTSFSTPVVSSIAANLWEEVSASAAFSTPDPALIKGLVVHSALLSDAVHVGEDRAYFGAGVPNGGLAVLFDGESSFTTVHRATLGDGIAWWKDPFPVPACLLSVDGRLQAEIFMTLSYSPFIDSAHNSECVRSSIEASFGGVHVNFDGNRTITGIVPADAGNQWEVDRIEAGKWSPVKTYRRRFPQGKGGGNNWGLKLTMTERVSGERPDPQIAYAILTLRGLRSDIPVHQDGLKALRALKYTSIPLSNTSRLRLGN